MSDSDSGLDAFLDKKAKKKEKSKKIKKKAEEKKPKKEVVETEDDDLAGLDVPVVAGTKPSEAKEGEVAPEPKVESEPLPWFRQVEQDEEREKEQEKKDEENKPKKWAPGSSRLRREAQKEKFNLNSQEWATLEDAKKVAEEKTRPKTAEERTAEAAQREATLKAEAESGAKSSKTWKAASGGHASSSRGGGDAFDPKAASEKFANKWKAAKETERQPSGGAKEAKEAPGGGSSWRGGENRDASSVFGDRKGYLPPSQRGESAPAAPAPKDKPAVEAAAPAKLGGYIPPNQRGPGYVPPSAKPVRKEIVVEEVKKKEEAPKKSTYAAPGSKGFATDDKEGADQRAERVRKQQVDLEARIKADEDMKLKRKEQVRAQAAAEVELKNQEVKEEEERRELVQDEGMSWAELERDEAGHKASKKQQEAKRLAEEEEARKRVEEEAARKSAEEEAKRRAAEEESRRHEEDEAKTKSVKYVPPGQRGDKAVADVMPVVPARKNFSHQPSHTHPQQSAHKVHHPQLTTQQPPLHPTAPIQHPSMMPDPLTPSIHHPQMHHSYIPSMMPPLAAEMHDYPYYMVQHIAHAHFDPRQRPNQHNIQHQQHQHQHPHQHQHQYPPSHQPQYQQPPLQAQPQQQQQPPLQTAQPGGMYRPGAFKKNTP